MIRLALLVILFLGVAPFSARPQVPPCDRFENLAAMLMGKFGEVPALRGPLGDGKALGIIFINPMSQSWTVVVQRSAAWPASC